MRLRLRQRPTLLIALGVLLAVAGGAAMLPGVAARTALLAGWCAAAATHGALLLRHLVVTPPDRLRHHAAEVEDSRWAILGLTVLAAVAALAGVFTEIGGRGPRPAHSMPLGIAAILLSWAYLHVLFAVHYAHDYLLTGGGIEFPGGSKRPDWAEFLYLSFTIGMTAQVSDVTTASPSMRRLVLSHALVSFLFNAAILGLGVNLLAGSAAG